MCMPPLETRTDSTGETHIQRNPVSVWQLEMKDPIVLVSKVFSAFPWHLKSKGSQQERREVLQGRATIPRVPKMSQSIPGKTFSLHCLDFQTEDRHRHTPRWHVGQPCGKPSGKASWESLEGKPLIP